MGYVLGFIALLITVLGYGTCMIPVKKYDVGDGIFYQYFMCCQIWIGGLIVQLIRNTRFEPFAMIGGAIWMVGNVIIFKVVEYIGLGIGIVVWAATAMIVAWASGFFGILGVNQQTVNIIPLNICGVIIIISSIILMFFVKSNAINKRNNLDGTHDVKRTAIGFALAVIAGSCFGLAFNPVQYLVDSGKGNSTNLLDYAFSYYSGILLSSTVILVVYSVINSAKNRDLELDSGIILPSLLSGLLWGLGSIFSFVAITELGFIIFFPIIGVGPGIVSNLIMVYAYKEIEGRRNYIYLCSSISAGLCGIVLIVLSLVL